MPDLRRMRGLTIVVTGADPDRLRGALTLALANVALGGEARMFLDGPAVALLAPPIAAPGDPAFAAAGLPTLAELHGEAVAAGIAVMLCQSGLALVGLAATDFPAGTGFGGMIGVMAALGDDRLVIA